ncbi:MAG: thioesterase family protein [Phycisphaerales bacterium]
MTQPPTTNCHHTLQLRVRYCECDPMGVAHHASYVPWMEMGRTELLRATGVSYAQLEKDGVFLVIVRLNVSYKRPIRYDDVVEVRTKWTGGGKVKIEHEYELWVVEQGGHAMGAIAGSQSEHAFLAATGQTTLGCVDKAGKIQALPSWLAG